ncbi:aspartyl-phosphate phosphatase Spo0E family protein [Lentibacillus salinarum]|uniref:Aspartyl-phosphate phosphatase Spo0E family protein n=1 Tax=Lentibacillus salinarum TaxID=446820 RepID=A0ABW3ZRF3_9BACI
MEEHSLLLQKIENYRHKMLELSSEQELTASAVIESSQRLDELIYVYLNS